MSIPDEGFSSSVVKVAPSGKQLAEFSLTGVPGVGQLGDSTILRNSVTPVGQLSLLVGVADRVLVVTYSSTGQHRSSVALEGHGSEYFAKQVSTFPSGEMLLLGGSAIDGRPLARILSAQGRFVAEVALTGDTTTRKSDGQDSSPVWSDLSMLESGPDGRAYLARPAPKGKIYAITAAGEVAGTIDLAPPADDAHPVSLKVGRNRLAVEYVSSSETESVAQRRWIVTHDLASGEPLQQFVDVPGPLICYSTPEGMPDAFTLLGDAQDGEVLRMLHALAR